MAIDHEVLNPLIDNCSRSVGEGYQYLNNSDISQEMWMWVYGNRDSVEKYVKEGPEGVRLLGFRLRSIGHRWAAKELAAARGVEYEDVHVYTLGSIRLILADVFDYEDWQSHQVVYDDMPKVKAQTNMTGDRIAMLSDVSRVLKYLQDDQYNAIIWIFKQNWTYEELATYLDISVHAARKRVDRAVGRIRTLLMGTEKDTDQPEREYVGTRRSVSNSTAMSYQSNTWG
jgi:DNA-directed RNA polymerase specialized sigma24 family protein